MITTITTPTKAFIDKIVAYAKQRPEAKQSDAFIKFIQLYYTHSSLEDLETRTISDLYGAVLSHWELMSQRNANELKIRVFNPHYEQQGWQSTHTIVEIVADDMPFLVDSMRMEINRMGLTTHLMVHMGGMRVVRDSQGRVVDILSFTEKHSGTLLESPIYMEIDRQTDPKILSQIENNLIRVLQDVRSAVEDWEKMQQRIRSILKVFLKLSQQTAQLKETIAFLEWILEDHFTFLGARDYELIKQGDETALRLVSESSLGVLKNEAQSKVYRPLADLPEQAHKQILSNDCFLLISKTNTRATVHRMVYTDCIDVKWFDASGQLIGMRRFIGLYTSNVYTSNPKVIPFARQKVDYVMNKSGLPPRSHAGKDLMHILSTLPRDDLFLASEEELYNLAIGILHLQERRRIRLFAREDTYGRFISCLVFVPRENFNADLVRHMQEILMNAFQGLEISLSTHFSASILVRIHYVIRIDPHKKLTYDLKMIERKLIAVGQSWRDGLRESVLEYFGEERGCRLIGRYINAFPAGYREIFSPRSAVFDIENIESLSLANALGMSFYRPLGASKKEIRFKLFRAHHTVPLSDTLPILENMGLRVMGEQPYQITLNNGDIFWINDFSMIYDKNLDLDVEAVKEIFQEAFNKVWLDQAENDSFNHLILGAQLSWREISVLRGYAKFLRQIGFTFSVEYIAETLINNPVIAKCLIELFHYRFDPEHRKNREEKARKIEDSIHEKLEEVAILDEDRILRRFLDVMKSTIRTNYFQKNQLGLEKSYLSLKFDSQSISEIPLPAPKYEIFVYSPRFQGVHLRAGKVARGGIRWSDRREDFRTEVLGLMKAQQVKNALIVPAGAKGGFVPMKLPVEGTREEIIEEGIACYRGFIQGLLDLTDNLIENQLIPPTDTVCYDDPDPYLVVAADKGTATFSDIANSIALEREFWLGDAFASGGSTGYDHKKMGITARGVWVSAERHFQELGINVDESEITVAGIGDMSGDVFGNGLLMSSHLKLVAAFNHIHIFIDPDPDPKTSYEERVRLFNLPRSTWDDYNRKLISEGGGVFSRSVKFIQITPEMKQLLRITEDRLVPNDLIRAILKAPVDLIWNGGIGTYVKSSVESNQDVGDRSNDSLRVNANELHARVVCEGGNLGLTQLARIEYELNGGRINTDFIDNSAGVDCSDHEVNIKILLNNIVANGDMTEKQRNILLAKMTEEVAELVLRNNYLQNRALSWAFIMSMKHFSLYIRYMEAQEQTGKLNRALEFLPDNKILLQRRSEGLGLTKPELAILLAYSKIILEDEIRKSSLTEDKYLAQSLKDAFPTPLRERYEQQLNNHRLKREIISTQLSNRLVSDMGITFIFQMQDELGVSVEEVICAYVAAREIFHMEEIFIEIESLDFKVNSEVQHRMVADIVSVVRRATRWLLRNRRHVDIAETVQYFAEKVEILFRRLPKLILGDDKIALEERRNALIVDNVPTETAIMLASAIPMYHALNIIEVATVHEIDIHRVAKTYFLLVDRFNLFWFRDQINAYTDDTRWSSLAKANYKGDLDYIQRQLTSAVLYLETNVKSVIGRINAYFEKYEKKIERISNIMVDLGNAEANEFAIISVAIRELLDLAQVSLPKV